MDPIRAAMRNHDWAKAKELAISRVRASPNDPDAIALLLEVERAGIMAERRKRELGDDDSLTELFPRRRRRWLDTRLTVVVSVVAIAVGGWWLAMGIQAGPTGSFPVRGKTGNVHEVRRPEALATSAAFLVFGAGAAGLAWWRLRRE